MHLHLHRDKSIIPSNRHLDGARFKRPWCWYISLSFVGGPNKPFMCHRDSSQQPTTRVWISQKGEKDGWVYKLYVHDRVGQR